MEDTLIKDFRKVLSDLGVNLDDPNFKDTPLRVARMYMHFFRNERSRVVKSIKRKVFPSKNDQIVLVKDIVCFGMCPHHLLPVIYDVAIGYIPNGKVLGLSKLARLAIAECSYPKLQEDVTKEIADTLEDILDTKGLIVIMTGQHSCMKCRGIEMNAECVTSDCRGILRDPGSKSEFLKLLGNRE